jgi:transcriptional regulator with XRE-family HTH domain
MPGNALGEYLRARRGLISPESAGIPHIGRRRVPGLRRDELSLLAGVSTDYYVRLEQGRDRHPSPQVLDALARALQLDDEATAHLHALAAPERRAHRSGRRPERVPSSIQQLIAGWHGAPAFVQGRRLDVLAANPLATALSPHLTPGVNQLRAAFLDPAVRTLYGDQWESLAHSTIAGAGPYALWALKASGYVDVGRIVGEIAADRTDVGLKSIALLRGDLTQRGEYLRVAFDHAGAVAANGSLRGLGSLRQGHLPAAWSPKPTTSIGARSAPASQCAGRES